MAIAAAPSPSRRSMPPGEAGSRPDARPHGDGLASRVDTIPPIYLVAVAVMAGDALGNLNLAIPSWAAPLAFTAAVLLYFGSKPVSGRAIALLGIIAAASVPAHRLRSPAPDDPRGIQRLADRSAVAIEGRIVRPTENFPGRTHLLVRVERAAEGSKPLQATNGTVRITILAPQRFMAGDQVRVIGRIRFPYRLGDPGEFNYPAYLERQGIDATLVIAPHAKHAGIEVIGHREIFPTSAIERIRGDIRRFIEKNLRGSDRAEMEALVIGDRGGIGGALRDRFARTGMAHLLVISGLHLSFVAAAAFGLARFLLGFWVFVMQRGWGNKLAALLAAIAVSAYASIAGSHLSTMRALAMVLSYTLAIIADRAREVLASLALAAITVCFIVPGSTADVGFQLSFASVLVIVLGMRRFTRWWQIRIRPATLPGERPPWSHRAAAITAGFVAVSFWAMLGTAPLTAFHFNQFSVVGLIANAVVVPIMGFGGTVCGLAASALSFISIPAATIVLRMGGYLLAMGTALAGWFLDWPLSWCRIFTPTILELLLAYGFLALWLTMPLAARGIAAVHSGGSFCGWRRLVFAVLVAVSIIDAGWWSWDRYFDRDLRVTFLSVGEGDAAVVRFPGSRVMLIDGGGSYGPGFDLGERIVAPFLWAHKIMQVDYLVLSHPDLDHFGGFGFIARNFGPAWFWTSDNSRPDVRYRALLAALAESHVRLRLLNSSTPPLQIGGVTIRFLGPRPGALATSNDASMVMRLGYGSSSFLFTGDIEAPAERALVSSARQLASTVLKVPHHGSRTSSTAAFLEAVRPALAVISLGYLNRYGFPAPGTIARLGAVHARVLRTDRDGAVTVSASRGGWRLWTWRTGPIDMPASSRSPDEGKPHSVEALRRQLATIAANWALNML